MLYYRGETRKRVSERTKERFGVHVPPRTLSAWLAEYRTLTTYARLREHGRQRFTPHQLIRSTHLHHKIAQLMVYALALSRHTGLKLFDFVCAWFDEHHYYEFFPLHVVHKRQCY